MITSLLSALIALVAALAAWAGVAAQRKNAERQIEMQRYALDRQIEAQLSIASRQTRASIISAARQKWLSELREEVSKVISLRFMYSLVHNEHIEKDPNWPVSSTLSAQLETQEAKIALLLDPDNPSHERLLANLKDYSYPLQDYAFSGQLVDAVLAVMHEERQRIESEAGWD